MQTQSIILVSNSRQSVYLPQITQEEFVVGGLLALFVIALVVTLANDG
jgi:hypothetical protein